MINLLNELEVLSIIEEIESPANVERKRHEFRAKQVEEGGLEVYVQNELKKIFPKTWESYHVAHYSVLKRIVDALSKAYKVPPLRQLATPQESAAYGTLVKEAMLDEEMKKLDRTYNRHNYALIGATVQNNAYTFLTYSPFEFDVIFNDLNELECVIISVPPKSAITKTGRYFFDTKLAQSGSDNEGQNSRFYALWTKENHVLIKYTKKDQSRGNIFYQPIDNNPNYINPFGVIPFAYVPIAHDGNYPHTLPTADQTIVFNALLSIYLTSGSMQIGQLVLKYPQDQQMDMVVSGLMTAIKLPQSKNPDDPSTEASYISPAPNMEGHKDSIMTYLTMILDERGIASTSVESGNNTFTSALDRLLASESVREIVEENQMMYSKVESYLFEIIKAIELNYFGRTPFDSDSITVKYEKPKMMRSEIDTLGVIEKANQLGVIEEHEKLMIYNPNLSEDEAKEKLERINESKRNAVNAYFTGRSELSSEN
jgi:hypothetical protein